MALTHREISIVLGMLALGDKQQDIAAYFGENQARVNEIKAGTYTGSADAEPAPLDQLPPAGPRLSGRSAQRALSSLHALRELIDETIAEIEGWERGE